MHYWLIKSEETCYSIHDFARDKETDWTGIRNYQARNFMRDSMKVGDMVLFYHSNSSVLGIYGIGVVSKSAHPDETQFDSSDAHYDPKATKERPIWMCVSVKHVQTFRKPVSLSAIKQEHALRDIPLLRPGNRLSVQPVSKEEYDHILSMR